MKFISIKLFTILIIALVLLSIVESRNNKKKIPKKSLKKLNRIAEEFSSMVTGFDWEKDPFLKNLKNHTKYLQTANSTERYFLIKCIIGKTIQLLKVKDDLILKALEHLDEKKKIVNFTLIMKFQKSGNLDDLKPLATNVPIKDFGLGNFVPGNRGPLLKFLNLHIRQNK